MPHSVFLCSLTEMLRFLSVRFFFFLPLCFHLWFSWVHFYLYANNVPVLRKEAAYLFTSGLNTCMHAYTCTHTQCFGACRSVHPFLSYSETSHLLILLSFVSFLHFVFLLLCRFMFSVFNYFSLIVHDLMHVHILCTPKKWYSWCIKSQREVSGWWGAKCAQVANIVQSYSGELFATDLQTSCDLQIGSRTVHREILPQAIW